MVTAGWPHSHSPTFIFPSVNYAGKGLLSRQACSQHYYGFSQIGLHLFTLGSCPVQPQSSALCPLEQLESCSRALWPGLIQPHQPDFSHQWTGRTWTLDLTDTSTDILRLQLSRMCNIVFTKGSEEKLLLVIHLLPLLTMLSLADQKDITYDQVIIKR